MSKDKAPREWRELNSWDDAEADFGRARLKQAQIHATTESLTDKTFSITAAIDFEAGANWGRNYERDWFFKQGHNLGEMKAKYDALLEAAREMKEALESLLSCPDNCFAKNSARQALAKVKGVLG